jgi:hypothetical protein
MMPDYEYHFFISYRRSDKRWIRWARENVAEALETLLRPALGKVKIFVDWQIETGFSWPDYLARALGRSRILVPLLSRDYFNSDWCRLELALMRDREERCKFRCSSNPAVLILPFVYDDGDCFPVEVREMQPKAIHDYANPFVRPDSPSFEIFSEVLRGECPRLEEALRSVPPFNPEWEKVAYQQFRERFRIQVAAQTSLPALSLLPINGNEDST